jgi:hypothetical protein
VFESRNFADKLSPAQLTKWVIEQVNAVDGLEVEYYEIVNAKAANITFVGGTNSWLHCSILWRSTINR